MEGHLVCGEMFDICKAKKKYLKPSAGKGAMFEMNVENHIESNFIIILFCFVMWNILWFI